MARSLPHFRGKWQVVDRLHRALLPLRGAGDDLRTVRMKDGSLMTWSLRDAAEGRAVWLGMWDDQMRDAVCARLTTGAVVLDIGASVGAWTVPMARRLGAPALDNCRGRIWLAAMRRARLISSALKRMASIQRAVRSALTAS